jgi:mannose/fructose/N-acetylgalactosamine-specific phosphotransferase system component IIB
VRRLAFTAAARAQFFTLVEQPERQVSAVERLLVIAKDPEKALALVGGATRIRRANIGGFCFFVLPVEVSKNFPRALLLVVKVRPI